MTYYPYFRGKQFELLAIRESAELIAGAGFIPIVEPVRKPLNGLKRALDALAAAGARAIIIVNPRHGDFATNGTPVKDFLGEEYRGFDGITPGILIDNQTTQRELDIMLAQHPGPDVAIVHGGYTDPAGVVTSLGERLSGSTNAFLEDHANLLYRRRFGSSTRILIRDGFEQMRNADYAEVDGFSDLHVTFGDMGMQGFGDFLTVGEGYSEGGGPAYTVAIHLTFIDEARDAQMFVYHFKSDTNDTPIDPGGKFLEALGKLIRKLDETDHNLVATTAIAEFRRLYALQHFPGLGVVKKLSMIHHLETLAEYLRPESHNE